MPHFYTPDILALWVDHIAVKSHGRSLPKLSFWEKMLLSYYLSLSV